MIRFSAAAYRPEGRILPVALAGALGLWLGFPNDLASIPPLVLLWPLVLLMLVSGPTVCSLMSVKVAVMWLNP